MTATVVDATGRLMRTIEGAEYFLGRMWGTNDDDWAAMEGEVLQAEEMAALGLLEELLAV